MTTSDSVSPTAQDARRAARNAGAIAAASVLSKGALFFWQLALARAVGEASYGIYGTVGAFFAVGTAIVNFGMGPIVIRDVARAPQLAGKYLTATLFMQTGLAVIAYGLINGAAALGGYEDALRALLALAAVSLLVDILGNMTNDLLLAQERMLASSLVTIGHIILLISLAGLALLAGWDLVGVYFATILAGLGRAAALWVLVLRRGVRPQLPFDASIAMPLLRNGAPLALAAFLALAYQHADKLMTTRFIGSSQTGYLTAAFVIVFGIIELLSTTVLIATYPMMSRYYQDGQGDVFGFMVEKLAFFTLLVSVPIALVLSIFAPEITVPLFGPNFAPTADVLRILIWYTVVAMTANVFARGLVVQNRQRSLLAVRATGLALNILLNALLIPRVGIIGAACASLAAELLVLSVLLHYFKASGWDLGRMQPRLLRLLLLSGAVAAGMLLLGRVQPLLGLVGGPLLYAGGVSAGWVLAADDWDLIYRLVAAMPGGKLIRRFWKRDVPVNW
jgi:O-antigen/teichoic acid export membrane protein